ERGEGDERLALKKCAAQLTLQRYDGVGQRGLGDAAAPSRSREIALLAERQEVADLVHLHGGPPRGINRARVGACHRPRRLTVRWFTERRFSSLRLLPAIDMGRESAAPATGRARLARCSPK